MWSVYKMNYLSVLSYMMSYINVVLHDVNTDVISITKTTHKRWKDNVRKSSSSAAASVTDAAILWQPGLFTKGMTRYGIFTAYYCSHIYNMVLEMLHFLKNHLPVIT